jgi:hypothetical protein
MFRYNLITKKIDFFKSKKMQFALHNPLGVIALMKATTNVRHA